MLADVAAAGKREVLRMGIDSGAARSVIPLHAANDYPVTQDERSGTKYVVADGHEVKDQGLKKILGACHGRLCAVKTRVTDVHKPLLAVHDMCLAGQRVVFEIRNGVNLSYAEHVDTGEVTPFEMRDRVWELDFEVVPHGEVDSQVGHDGPDAQPLYPFPGPVSKTVSPEEETAWMLSSVNLSKVSSDDVLYQENTGKASKDDVLYQENTGKASSDDVLIQGKMGFIARELYALGLPGRRARACCRSRHAL